MLTAVKSFDQEPIGVNDQDLIKSTDLYFGLNKVIIDESVFYSEPREMEYLSLVSTHKSMSRKFELLDELNGRRIIDLKFLMMSNEGEKNKKTAKNLIGALGNLGGLYSLTLLILTGVYHFFGEPFRNLHLALSFNQMKNAICR